MQMHASSGMVRGAGQIASTHVGRDGELIALWLCILHFACVYTQRAAAAAAGRAGSTVRAQAGPPHTAMTRHMRALEHARGRLPPQPPLVPLDPATPSTCIPLTACRNAPPQQQHHTTMTRCTQCTLASSAQPPALFSIQMHSLHPSPDPSPKRPAPQPQAAPENVRCTVPSAACSLYPLSLMLPDGRIWTRVVARASIPCGGGRREGHGWAGGTRRRWRWRRRWWQWCQGKNGPERPGRRNVHACRGAACQACRVQAFKDIHGTALA